jgi:hypothetical protein
MGEHEECCTLISSHFQIAMIHRSQAVLTLNEKKNTVVINKFIV